MSVIDDYVAGYSGAHREQLDELLALIRELAPQAQEKISWSMPTFTMNGNLVHFAAGKNHIGFYPGASGVELAMPLVTELGLKHSKGAIQFPVGKPLPCELVRLVVEQRVIEQQAKSRPAR